MPRKNSCHLAKKPTEFCEKLCSCIKWLLLLAVCITPDAKTCSRFCSRSKMGNGKQIMRFTNDSLLKYASEFVILDSCNNSNIVIQNFIFYNLSSNIALGTSEWHTWTVWANIDGQFMSKDEPDQWIYCSWRKTLKGSVSFCRYLMKL